MPLPTNNNQSPLRVMFLTTSMPVGGAETLLASLVRGLDRERFTPEIACLKEPGPLGDELAAELPVHSRLLAGKYDPRVLVRLCQLLRRRKIDAVVTVGAGDKMFWGRLAARLAGVPVVLSALHSTGWPDGVGRLNRLLTPITDGFIGVADAHAEHLIRHERFPRDKVSTIYNGIDTDRFSPGDGAAVRQRLGLAEDAPTVGILAALRPEKNHRLFLDGAERVLQVLPAARFLIVGDGPCRGDLERQAERLGIASAVQFLGSQAEVPELLRAIDLLALTSHNEASPVSILESLSCGVPVVASEVGSVAETVLPNQTGLLFPEGDLEAFVDATSRLLKNPTLRVQLGQQGRKHVLKSWSLNAMIDGYSSLITRIYRAKTEPAAERQPGGQTDPAADASWA